MDPTLRTALLMNAAHAPLRAFEKLCAEYAPEDVVREELWQKLGLTPKTQSSLARLLLERDWPEREQERADRFGARFLVAGGPDYPARLLDLPQPPLGLYVRGRSDMTQPSAAVVGTRRCSAYGKSVAESLGRELARAGFMVVSGGARGVDAAGHRGCLAEGGLTAAVLGTGIDRVYPAEHRDLFARIAEQGVLISEYPMGANGEAWHFPERNRIIVGMAGRTVVVESPEDGGAMISARLALDLGREVWGVPGRITEDVCRGVNRLLRDGAEPLVDVGEFIHCISGRYGQLVLDLEETPRPQPALSTDEKVVLALLQRQGGRTMDELLAESGLDFVTLQTCMMTLSANGLAIVSGPGRFSASV